MEFAAVELCQLNTLVALHGLEDETGEDLDGVGALLVDIVARVTAYETFQGTFDEEAALGGCLALEGELGGGVTASGTADEDLTLML